TTYAHSGATVLSELQRDARRVRGHIVESLNGVGTEQRTHKQWPFRCVACQAATGTAIVFPGIVSPASKSGGNSSLTATPSARASDCSTPRSTSFSGSP